MRLGVTLPQFREDAEPALAAARRAETAGLDGVFVFDHLWPLHQPERPALHSLTQGARIVLAPRGVAVLGVYPGPVDTEMSRSIQIEKASAQDVAQSILDGVEAGNDDIFPDPFAAAFGEYFQSSPKGSERQVAAMMSGAAAA